MTAAPTPAGAPPAPAPVRVSRDLAWAYAAAIGKVGSWAVVAALLYRHSPADFALFALLRATIGFLSYSALGLAPAMIHLAAKHSAPAQTPDVFAEPEAIVGSDLEDGGEDDASGLSEASHPGPLPRSASSVRARSASSVQARSASSVQAGVPGRGDVPPVLNYSAPATESDLNALASDPLLPVHASALVAGRLVAAIGLGLTLLYATFFHRIHTLPGMVGSNAFLAVIFLGGAIIVRLYSDLYGATLQIRNHISLDNGLLLVSEVVWVLLLLGRSSHTTVLAAGAYFGASVLLLACRAGSVEMLYLRRRVGALRPHVRRRLILALLSYGALVTLSQLANFLYAPANFIIIDRLLDARALAAYAPALQIDTALLILVAGLASVMLPHAARAHATGQSGRATVWRQYVRGTLASLALLLGGALLVWAMAPWLFKVWFGDDLPATRAILPLVMAHTVFGGSSDVGRSILLATGHARAFTISVLIAGVANVGLAWTFVGPLHMGLAGIPTATVIVVTARCLIWMPWYVRRITRVEPAGDGG